MADSLFNLVVEATNLRRELAQFEGAQKLTSEAFLKEAISNAGLSDDALAEVSERLATGPDLDPARAFVRRLAKQMVEPTWPRPPQEMTKVLRIFGTDETGHQLAQADIKIAEAIAVAVSISIKKFPHRFGTVDGDYDDHMKKAKVLRARLERHYDEMRTVVCGADLAFDDASLTPSERASGLVRAHFRRWPGVLFAGDWPRSITAAHELNDLEAAEAAVKSKPRRQLAA